MKCSEYCWSFSAMDEIQWRLLRSSAASSPGTAEPIHYSPNTPNTFFCIDTYLGMVAIELPYSNVREVSDLAIQMIPGARLHFNHCTRSVPEKVGSNLADLVIACRSRDEKSFVNSRILFLFVLHISWPFFSSKLEHIRLHATSLNPPSWVKKHLSMSWT